MYRCRCAPLHQSLPYRRWFVRRTSSILNTQIMALRTHGKKHLQGTITFYDSGGLLDEYHIIRLLFSSTLSSNGLSKKGLSLICTIEERMTNPAIEKAQHIFSRTLQKKYPSLFLHTIKSIPPSPPSLEPLFTEKEQGCDFVAHIAIDPLPLLEKEMLWYTAPLYSLRNTAIAQSKRNNLSCYSFHALYPSGNTVHRFHASWNTPSLAHNEEESWQTYEAWYEQKREKY